MHRALSIAEIRYLICTFATDPTLARLARCSKDFHKPAIQVLWDDIPDLSPLVRCFPQDAWTVAPGSRSVTLVRSPAPEDWANFLKYSTLVRKLGTSSFDLRTVRLEERAIWELSAYRPVLILLPNLVAFEWSGLRWSEEELPVALGFLNPNMSQIRIGEWRGDQGPLRSSLSLIANRFTHLKCFQLAMGSQRSRVDPPLMPSILPFIRNSSKLEIFDFTCIPLTQDVLIALASHQNLTQLAIRLPEAIPWSIIDLRENHFRNLQVVTIVSRPQDYIDFSSKTSFPRAQIVHIRLADVLTQENDLPRFFASICSQFSAPVLKRLTVVMDDSTMYRRLGDQAANMVVRLEDLQLFFKFEKLSSFNFSIASRYALDPAAYLAIAKAWPHMKSFQLGLADHCVHSDLPNIRDVLVPFAVHCAKLNHLGVRFDGSSRAPGLRASDAIVKALPLGEPSTSVVNSLDCFNSPVARTPHVAAFLALLFPRLKVIRWKQPSQCPWGEVQQYLPLFAIVREDGRREAAKEAQQS